MATVTHVRVASTDFSSALAHVMRALEKYVLPEERVRDVFFGTRHKGTCSTYVDGKAYKSLWRLIAYRMGNGCFGNVLLYCRVSYDDNSYYMLKVLSFIYK